MKKAIPVLIAIVLIIIIGAMTFGKKVYDKYSYGQERADLNEYFQIFSSSDVPIILQDARINKSARLIDGHIYLDRDLVEEYFTERFYLDTKEKLLIFTSGVTSFKTELESKSYSMSYDEVSSIDYPTCLIKNDTLYIAIDYLKIFVPMSYEYFTEPNRVQIYTEWGRKTVATIKGATQVRWRAGVKSEILTDVTEGDVVELLEPLDDWYKVKTKDAYIGYVEKKFLSDERYEDETPVTITTGYLSKESGAYPSLTRDHKINLTWHNIEYPQDGADLKKALANVKSLNVVSPTWLWLTDNDGGFKHVCNSNYAETAHNMGLEVWALVSNFHSGTNVDLTELLSYTSKREKLAKDLVETVLSYGADGINLDFENVPKKAADHYVQFVRELGVECHRHDLVLSVDHYVPSDWTAHYNRHEQSNFADYIIIMGYDEHYEGSDVGSVASMPWMEKGITDTLKYVPANKVINAIPFYTRVWKTKGDSITSEAVTMDVAKNFITKNKVTTKWDEETKQNYGEITMNGTLWQVWLEDADSVKVRLNVMDAAGVAGVASWKVGQETPDIWDLIEAYMQK